MNTRIALFALFVFIVGCAGQKPPEVQFAERTAACRYGCAELAMAIAESGLHDAARKPLSIALEHAQDPMREDVPFHPPELMAHRLKLAVLGAVIAHHVDEVDEGKALDGLWEQVREFLETRSFSSLNHTNVRFLNRADRGWLLRQIEMTSALDEQTRRLMALVWRVNSAFEPDRMLMDDLSREAETVPEHLLAAYTLCMLRDCESERIVVHLHSLVVDQMGRHDDDIDEALMDSWLVAQFLKVAGPQHSAEVLWVRDYYRDHGLRPSWIPILALGEGRACREFHGMHDVVVRRRASYEALLIAARCAYALDYEGYGNRLLARAAKLRDDDAEAAEARWEHELFANHTGHMRDVAKRLAQPRLAEQAARAAHALDAIYQGDSRAARVDVLELPPGDVRSYLSALIAVSEGDYATAEPLLAALFEKRTTLVLGSRLAYARLALGDMEGAREVTSRGFALRPRHWAFLHGRTAIARHDDGDLDDAIEALEHGEASCWEGGQRARLVAARSGPAAGLKVVRQHLMSMRRPTALCTGRLAFQASRFAPSDAVFAAFTGAGISEAAAAGSGGLPGCSDDQLARWRTARAADATSESVANSLAWCLAERGAFEEGLEVLPAPGDVHSIRDTYARLLLGVGRHAEASEIWSALVQSEPRYLVYRVHLLAAQLAAGTATRRDVDLLIGRLVRAARLRDLPDSFVLGTLADELRKAGYRSQEKALWMAYSDGFSPITWYAWKRVRAGCPECEASFRERWGRAPLPSD